MVLERPEIESRDEHVTEIVSTAESHERASPPSSPVLLEHTVRTITSSLASPEHASDVNTESRSGIKPKLPKLQLPKFAGDITKFRTFWDSFNSAIHCNDELSAIDKFNNLKALLEGPAAQAIQGLTLSEANYMAAIELIKERLGKTQQIISAHIDELLKLPSCTDDKAVQIRLVYDKISVNIRGLESLGIGSD